MVESRTNLVPPTSISFHTSSNPLGKVGQWCYACFSRTTNLKLTEESNLCKAIHPLLTQFNVHSIGPCYKVPLFSKNSLHVMSDFQADEVILSLI